MSTPSFASESSLSELSHSEHCLKRNKFINVRMFQRSALVMKVSVS